MPQPTRADDELKTALMQTHVTPTAKKLVAARRAASGESEATYLRRLVMTDLRLPRPKK
jgi:hypothetical protein